jgi:hypothetical protein
VRIETVIRRLLLEVFEAANDPAGAANAQLAALPARDGVGADVEHGGQLGLGEPERAPTGAKLGRRQARVLPAA